MVPPEIELETYDCEYDRATFCGAAIVDSICLSHCNTVRSRHNEQRALSVPTMID